MLVLVTLTQCSSMVAPRPEHSAGHPVNRLIQGTQCLQYCWKEPPDKELVVLPGSFRMTPPHCNQGTDQKQPVQGLLAPSDTGLMGHKGMTGFLLLNCTPNSCLAQEIVNVHKESTNSGGLHFF